MRVLGLQIEKGALRQQHGRVRLGHLLVLQHVELVGAAGARQEIGAETFSFKARGKVHLRDGRGVAFERELSAQDLRLRAGKLNARGGNVALVAIPQR